MVVDHKGAALKPALMIGVVALVALLATHTFEMLALLTIAYIAAVPLMVRRYRSLERSHAAESAAKSDS